MWLFHIGILFLALTAVFASSSSDSSSESSSKSRSSSESSRRKDIGCNPELRVIDVINQNIFKVNTADLTFEDLGTTPRMIFGGIAVDCELGLMFYATGSVIYYANIDGTDTQQLVDLSSEITTIRDLAVDPGLKIIFLPKIQPEHSIQAILSIEYSDIAYPNVNTIILNPQFQINNPSGIKLDKINRKVYWTDTIVGNIARADYDGNSAEKIIEHTISTSNVALDPNENKMYWESNSKLYSAALDGSNVEELFDIGNLMDIDLIDDFFYVTHQSSMRRHSKDGSLEQFGVGTFSGVTYFDVYCS